VLGGVVLDGRRSATSSGSSQNTSTKYIEGQKAVVIVIPVEEAPFLAAMYRHLGGVEIENNLLGWPAE